MATAFAVGSLLAQGAGAASAAGVIGATGIGTIGFGSIATGLGIAGQVAGGLQQFGAAKAEGEFAAMAAESKAIGLESDIAREKTQAELEALGREKSLQALLASQRARFGGAGIDPFTGSPARIAEVSQSEVLRQDRQAGLFSALTISSLNRQIEQERMAGVAAKSAAKTKAGSALLSSLSGAGAQAQSLIDLQQPKFRNRPTTQAEFNDILRRN